MERLAADSYRSEDQVSAEAEVLHIIQSLRANKYSTGNREIYEHFYFVSQSTVLNRVMSDGSATTWSPEAVYRYLTALPAHPPDPELLQQCMLHQYPLLTSKIGEAITLFGFAKLVSGQSSCGERKTVSRRERPAQPT